mgnify:FL=1
MEIKNCHSIGCLKLWVARLLIAAVIGWNLQAAIFLLANPAQSAKAFQLTGVPGEAAVIGVAILFLMWQVPYLFALAHPLRFKLSLIQALIMQAIGLLGESLLLSRISPDYPSLRVSITRFVIFDAAGLVLLLAALLLVRLCSHQSIKSTEGAVLPDP